MVTYEQIFSNNAEWIASKRATDTAFFEKLALEQNPDYLYIGCSDSRVTAEEMMGAGPGEVFVHRNIANVVSNTDLNVLSVIEYAVKQLHVKHIIVCGHYGCGGLHAALFGKTSGPVDDWLCSTRALIRRHRNVLDEIGDKIQQWRKLCELNVIEQVAKLVEELKL